MGGLDARGAQCLTNPGGDRDILRACGALDLPQFRLVQKHLQPFTRCYEHNELTVTSHTMHRLKGRRLAEATVLEARAGRAPTGR